jgi:hypothetical protein
LVLVVLLGQQRQRVGIQVFLVRMRMVVVVGLHHHHKLNLVIQQEDWVVVLVQQVLMLHLWGKIKIRVAHLQEHQFKTNLLKFGKTIQVGVADIVGRIQAIYMQRMVVVRVLRLLIMELAVIRGRVVFMVLAVAVAVAGVLVLQVGMEVVVIP